MSSAFKTFILLGILFIVPAAIVAQNTVSPSQEYPEGARPDIPGQLGIEFGISLVPDFPEEMELNLLGTNGFSGYYKYDINIGSSKFSVHPGLAITNLKYSFSNDVTLVSQPAGEEYETILVGFDSVSTDEQIKKSLLKSTYVEVPVELTFRTNRDFPKRSFKFTLGAKGGVLIASKTKVKFMQDNQNKVTKQKERYDLNQFRVTLVGRIGYGSINLYFNYSLLPVFEKDKGPLGTNAKLMNAGISLDLF